MEEIDGRIQSSPSLTKCSVTFQINLQLDNYLIRTTSQGTAKTDCMELKRSSLTAVFVHCCLLLTF